MVTAKAPRKKRLGKLTPEELQEFVMRRNLLAQKQQEFFAAGIYVDHLTSLINEKYELPRHYNVDTNTGIITEIPEPEE